MQRFLLAITLLFSLESTIAQTKYTGYLYTQQSGTKEKLQYSISTKFSDGAFQTIYKVYKPGANKNRYTITASHFKFEKKIIVEVNDEQYLLTVMNGKEEVEYQTEKLQPFGIRGNLGIFDKSAPNQLAVQFVSSRFEYVRVINFLGSSSDGIFQFFLFNKSDKINEPKRSISGEKENKEPELKRIPASQTDSTANRLFIGKKKFCDETDAWFYDVTIKGDSIVIKTFPGKSNDNYKNKSIPVTTVKGLIKNGKIFTKNGVDEFKYENDKFYELNNEGDYNEYKECK